MEEFISTFLFNCMNILIYLLEFMVVMDLFFDRIRARHKKVFISFLMLESAIVMTCCKGQMDFAVQGASWCALLVIMLLYEGEFKRKLFTTCLLGLSAYLLEKPMWICLEMLLKPGDQINMLDEICIRVSALITAIIIVSVLEHVAQRHKKAFIEHKWSIGESILCGFIITICIVGEYIGLLSLATDSLSLKGVSRGIYIFYILSILTVIALFVGEKWFKSYQDKQLEALQKEQALNDLAFYQSYETLCQEKRLVEEVVKNQGETLMQLAVEGKIEDLISHSERAIRPVEEKMVTGNQVIDVIINEQLVRSRKRGIELAVRMSVPDRLKMDTIDLCVILSDSIAYGMAYCEEKGYSKLSINALWLKGYVIYEVLAGIIRCTDLQAQETEIMSENLPVHAKLLAISEHIKAYDGRMTFSEEPNYVRLKLSFYAGSYESKEGAKEC